ncbi:hypothetical protein F4805DRAFT_472639 [Annulohypoxylon moriforme]|nr:hypothetical protein F4805DRAFT_472639 [Annulohypoxylon moriforme]
MASIVDDFKEIDVNELLLQKQTSSSRCSKSGFWLIYVSVVLFLISIFLFTNTHSGARCAQPSLTEMLKGTSSYSPIFDEVDLSPKYTMVDGRLQVPANASIFLAGEDDGIILVNNTALQRAGYNPALYFKAPLSWGYGEDQFPVQVDVFHQIHCLNILRKQIHYQYYYADKFPNGLDEIDLQHLRHCLHTVLQGLECSATVDIIPHRWVEKIETPFPDWNFKRKCRNFHNFLSWSKNNSLKKANEIWPHKESMPETAFVWPGFGE